MGYKYLYTNIHLLILCFLLISVSAKQAASTTRYEYNSTQFITEIKNSQELYFQKTIRFYDSLYLQKKEIKILIEKCRFMENALYDAESEENPKYDDWETCYDKLLNDYPDNPHVLYYKLEHLYDDSALIIAKVLLKQFQADSLYDRLIIANLYEKIAYSYSNMDSTEKAVSAYQSALKYNDTIKVHLSLAQEYVTLGQREIAHKIILNDVSLFDSWQKRTAAELLVQLRYPDDAVNIYSTLLTDTNSYIDFSNVAKAYEMIDNLDSARIFYIKALESTYDTLEAAKKLFEFDLQHSPWKIASQSYQHFRKLGFKADPLSFYRLRLFFKYPLYLLSWNSIPGFFLLLLVCVIIFLLPYIWLLPLHYLGRWLHRTKEPEKTLFSIRHLWLANAAMLLSWFVAAGLFQNDELIGLLTDRSISSLADDYSNTMFLIVFCLLMTISSLVLISGFKQWKLLKPRTSIGKTIGLLITSILFLFIVRKINFHFFPELISENARNISTGSIVVIIKSMLLTRGFFFTMIIVCVLVPFYEEFIFRGIGIEALSRYFPFWVTNLIQAASFALLHDSIQLFPSFFSMGLLFGWLYKHTQSLFISVLFHSLNNLLAIWGIWTVMHRHGL